MGKGQERKRGIQGTHLGELYLEIGPHGKLLSRDSRITPLEKKIPDDPEISSLLATRGFSSPGLSKPQPESEKIERP